MFFDNNCVLESVQLHQVMHVLVGVASESKQCSVVYYRQHRELLKKCAATALNSKLVAHQKEFFANMVVDAVMMLDELLPLNMIGIKKIQGGALEVCLDLMFLPRDAQCCG